MHSLISFHLSQVLGMLALWVAGGLSSAEWQKSRKLGGDPTIRNRDPQGLHAHTISNPHFRDEQPSPIKKVPAVTAKETPVKKTTAKVLSPMDIHRNQNGIAMTNLSGQPYMMTTQNGSNGHIGNGRPKRIETTSKNPAAPVSKHHRIVSGSRNKVIVTRSTKSPKHTRRPQPSRPITPTNINTLVAFDPSRTPLRSSLRKPKQQQQLQGSSSPCMDACTDSTDGVPDGGIPNPAFAQSSPPPKKKVRIHTQSTAV